MSGTFFASALSVEFLEAHFAFCCACIKGGIVQKLSSGTKRWKKIYKVKEVFKVWKVAGS